MRNYLWALLCASMMFNGGCQCNSETLSAVPQMPDAGVPQETPDATPPVMNVCGGTARLAHDRGEPCTRSLAGGCTGHGIYTCRGQDRVQCDIRDTECPEATPTPVVTPTPTPVPECSDPDLCVRGRWDVELGQCTYRLLSGSDNPCDDNDPCTIGDHCQRGLCQGGRPRDCAAELAPRECSTAVCNPATGCEYEPQSQWEPCDDNRYCTEADACYSGVCIGLPRDCTDPLRPCADMECDEARDTCVARPAVSGWPCDDDDACTLNDRCDSAYNCVGTPRACDDNNVCTANSCDNEFGCQTRNIQGASCDDGDPCTEVDRCSAGYCTGIDAPRGTPCNDGQFCTNNDACMSGVCVGESYVQEPPCLNVVCHDLVRQCTDTFCDEDNDRYFSVPKSNGVLCWDDVFCTTEDRCQEGVCQSGRPVDCEAAGWGDECNEGFCNEERMTCDSRPRPADTLCDDGNACTTGDHCAGSGITPGARAACLSSGHVPIDDGVYCTIDGCDPVDATITHTPHEPRCYNGSSVCVTPTCDPVQGCVYPPVPNGSHCFDGSQCTRGDACLDGECVAQEDDVTPPHGLRKIGWVQGPHFLYGPNVGADRNYDFDDELCYSGFDIIVLEAHDRTPMCANTPQPKFVKYMSLTVQHHGIHQCYDSALVVQYTVGDDPHGGPDDPNGNAVPEPVLDIRAPAVRNMLLNQYLPCLLQYDRNPGPDGFLVDTLGSLYDEFSYLGEAAVSLMGEVMNRYPQFMFLINDGWNVNWMNGQGAEHNAWDDIMDLGIAGQRDMTFIFESFYLDFEGQIQYIGNGTIRQGLPLDTVVHMRMRRDAAPAYIHLATLEHPPVDDNQNTCFLNGEAACYAWLNGMSPVLQQYFDPWPWCYWDPGLNTFVVNGECGDALVSPLPPGGPTCLDGSTP